MTHRAGLASMFRELLVQLDPGAALLRQVARDGTVLRLPAGETVDLAAVQRVFLVAFGKAARTMASAALPLFHGCTVQGVCAPPAGDTAPLEPLLLRPGGHPVPDAGSTAAAERTLALLGGAGENDLVVFLVSGGGSAILERPLVPETSLDDLRVLHRTLVGCGAPIDAINCVRKHCSGVKGGRLALRAAPARQVTLYVSDVPPGLPSAVASGPTMPDATTWQDALRVVDENGLREGLPASVRGLFAAAAAGRAAETPKQHDRAFARSSWHCLLDERSATAGLAALATARGLHCEVDHATSEMECSQAASALLARLRALRREHGKPVALVAGGEVRVRLPAQHGSGGRNQHFVLTSAQLVRGEPIAVLSAGTDGIDGNSPAAGAVADGTTLDRAAVLGIDVQAALEGFDSHPALHTLGDTVVTGPTGTNVRDVRILVHG